MLHITDVTILHSIAMLLISTGKSDNSHIQAQQTQIILPFIHHYILLPWREEEEENDDGDDDDDNDNNNNNNKTTTTANNNNNDNNVKVQNIQHGK